MTDLEYELEEIRQLRNSYTDQQLDAPIVVNYSDGTSSTLCTLRESFTREMENLIIADYLIDQYPNIPFGYEMPEDLAQKIKQELEK